MKVKIYEGRAIDGPLDGSFIASNNGPFVHFALPAEFPKNLSNEAFQEIKMLYVTYVWNIDDCFRLDQASQNTWCNYKVRIRKDNQ